jgi:hypothetical protein
MAVHTTFTYYEKFFDCPKTGQSEIATIQHISKTISSCWSNHPESTTTSNRNIRECSGMDTCGIKTTHETNPSISWELCPLLAILNK